MNLYFNLNIKWNKQPIPLLTLFELVTKTELEIKKFECDNSFDKFEYVVDPDFKKVSISLDIQFFFDAN